MKKLVVASALLLGATLGMTTATLAQGFYGPYYGYNYGYGPGYGAGYYDYNGGSPFSYRNRGHSRGLSAESQR
jgi:hypothetical protein